MRWALALLTIVVAVPVPAGALPACQSTCARQVGACRTECAARRGRGRHECVDACLATSTCTAPGARIRTLAYVVTECSLDPQGFGSINQKLVIRRGNCDPVTVMDIPLGQGVQDPIELCRIYGDIRFGPVAVAVGVFGRFVPLDDGSAMVFEVTNDFSLYPAFSPEPPEEGIFFVRADGTGLRRLGAASRFPFVGIAPDPNSPIGLDIFRTDGFDVSPDGRIIALIDLGPGPDGMDVPQVFTLDVGSGGRRQLTRLPAIPDVTPGQPAFCCPRFVDNRTIAFYYGPGLFYTVRTDASGLNAPPGTLAIPGARIVPRFEVTGGGGAVAAVYLPDRHPIDDYGIGPVVELFLTEGKRVLQLTNFDRDDTLGYLSGRRVLLAASADPFGTNPRQNCQLFSMNTLGSGLRQLTHFQDDGRPSGGCDRFLPGKACSIDRFPQDLRTHTIVFGSSCDPVGLNPYGYQVFAMRPDGSGIRQLTNARGKTVEADGTVRVEAPGSFDLSLGRR